VAAIEKVCPATDMEYSEWFHSELPDDPKPAYNIYARAMRDALLPEQSCPDY
jgi:hypothetical protein